MTGIIIGLVSIVVIFASTLYIAFGFWFMAPFLVLVYLFLGALIASSIPPKISTWIKIKMLLLWLPGQLSDRVFRIIES